MSKHLPYSNPKSVVRISTTETLAETLAETLCVVCHTTHFGLLYTMGTDL